ncbi:MAG TPA: M17 family peptidase N-terminal domain-containing protein, partial [Rhizomicrobium sp.]
MQISFSAPAFPASGAWVVAACSESALLPAAVKADRISGGALTRALKFSRFKGKPGQILEILAPSGTPASRILLLGLGKAPDLDAARLEGAVAGVMGRLATSGDAIVTFEIDVPKGAKMKSASVAAHVAFAARLKNYRFNQYRTKNLEEHQTGIKTAKILVSDAAAARKAWAPLSAVADGILLARDLVNEPPNVLFPAEFARRCKALSRLGVKVEVLGEAAMKKLGFGALLGVGQGSARESQLVVMQWNGA